MVGALSVIKARAPVTGGNFGVWGGMFSTFDCAVKGWRQKEDMWNAIISGFMTGGCLAARSAYSFLSLPHESILGSSLPSIHPLRRRVSPPCIAAHHCLLTHVRRWSQGCSHVSCDVRYLAQCLRGRWCSCVEGIQRGDPPSTTTM